ncbi:MAG: energy-coupling factor ABC transporter permease [Nitrospirota bacterium]
MSHLHIPDGVLPVWLWVCGFIAAMAAVLFSLYMVRGVELKKKVPLLGMMSAMMLVGMSIETPIAYHLNLSVITGIILGPWLAIVAAFMVNIILALVGHGGVTVVGLNTIVIGSEGVMGWLLFRIIRRFLKPGLASGISTVITLFISTCIMLLIVYIANINFNAAPMHELRDILETKSADILLKALSLKPEFNFRLFAIAAFGLGIFGWTIEALVTGTAIKFISRVKPDIIGVPNGGSGRES